MPSSCRSYCVPSKALTIEISSSARAHLAGRPRRLALAPSESNQPRLDDKTVSLLRALLLVVLVARSQ